MTLLLRAHTPIRTVSVINKREHYMATHRRTAKHRRETMFALLAEGRQQGIDKGKCPLPAMVIMTRIAPHKMDDDNLGGALKAVRDAVADWIGVDDGDDRVSWVPAQERGRPKEYAVRVEVHEHRRQG